jgi:hypothetical protein
MSEPSKDTIYIDVDEEITGIIDKVQSSDKKIVALVLPKRATVLQSVVNMKLLKRTTQRSKKSLVLITSEAGLLPLAGAVGLHVAKNLTSKPEIPDGPPKDELPESLVHEDEIESEPDEDPELDKAAAVGVLAGGGVGGAAAAGAVAGKTDAEDVTSDLDDAAASASSASASASGDKASATEKSGKSSKKDKKSKKDKAAGAKVPNFEKFRKLFIIGGLALIALVVFLYFAIAVWPKATITIDAQSSKLNTTVVFTADTTTKTFDASQSNVPSQLAQSKKTGTQSAPATGTKNIGSKAAGTVTIRNCDYPAFMIIAGSQFSGADGKVYISSASVNVPAYTGPSSTCTLSGSHSGKVDVPVQATTNGAASNTGAQSYSVPNVTSGSKVDGIGSAMAGGTDNVVKMVTQNDIEGAKAQLANATDPSAQATLTKQLQESGMYVIPSSFNAGAAAYSTNVNAGDQADNVTVTSTITYSLLGVNQANMKTLVENNAKGQIDTGKQSILSDGLSSATFTVQNPTDPKPKVSVQSAVVVGPKIDTDQIKQQVAGKKSADTRSTIESLPGVKSVTIKYSPFWVSKTPGKVSKITIVFKQASDK